MTTPDVWQEPTAATVLLLPANTAIEVKSGSVSVDARRAIERTCSLELVDHDGTVAAALEVPGRELQVFRDGVSLGIFGTLEIDRRRPDMTVTVSGSDRAARVSAYTFEKPWRLATIAFNGQLDSIGTILMDRMPGIALSWTVPYIGFDRLPSENVQLTGDPWAACRKLAASDGYRLFFDAEGVVQYEAWADILSSPVVTYLPGDTSSVSSLSVSSSYEGVFNGVILQYFIPGGFIDSPGLYVNTVIWDDAVGSPIAASLIGKRPVPAPVMPSRLTLAQWTPIVSAMLAESRGKLRKAGWVQSVNVALGVNTIVDVSAVCGLSTNVRVESLTIPLDPTGLMSVNGGREAGVGTSEMADLAASVRRTFTDRTKEHLDGLAGAGNDGTGILVNKDNGQTWKPVTKVLKVLPGAAPDRMLTTDTNGDAEWSGIPTGLPSGGTPDQVLITDINGTPAWTDQSALGGGALPFYGTVDSIQGDGTVTCMINGSAVSGLTFVESYAPVVGDTVLITETV